MIFTRAGFSALKFAYLVLLAGIGVAAFLVVGSYFYWQSEKKNDQQSQRSLQDLRARLSTAQRDRDDLRGSEDTYKALVARGAFLPEERFDLIEALAALKKRHRLVSLGYEVAPQRPLRLNAGATYSGVNLFASRVKLKIRAFHDADLVAFLDEFPRLQRGFFPLDRCAVKLIAAPLAAAAASNNAPDDDDVIAQPTRTAIAPPNRPAAISSPAMSLEAECSLEWITLQSKGGAAPLASSPKPTGRPQ